MFKSMSAAFVAIISLIASFAAHAEDNAEFAKRIRSEFNLSSITGEFTGTEYKGSAKCNLKVTTDLETGNVQVSLSSPKGYVSFFYIPANQNIDERVLAKAFPLIVSSGIEEGNPFNQFKSSRKLSAVVTSRQRENLFTQQVSITKSESATRVTVINSSSMDDQIYHGGVETQACVFQGI